MRSIYAIAALSLVLLSACGKEDYTCVCNDRTGLSGDRKFDIENKTQRVAQEECRTNETELNRFNNSFNCHLE